MRSRGFIAAKVAQHKAAHPADYCPAPRCLWQTHRDGVRISYCQKHERSAQRAETREHPTRPRSDSHPTGDTSPLPVGASSAREHPRCGQCGDIVRTNLDEGYCSTCGTVTWEPEYRTDAEQAEYQRQREARS